VVDGEPLEGDDAKCTVTILDEDFPGTLGFFQTDVQASRKDEIAHIKVERINGSDGKISCKIRTEAFSAQEHVDYEPLADDYTVTFEHGEAEKEVQI
jgi:hypothetical protein